MFEFQKPADPQAPSCPLCTHEMALKQIHRQKPSDHFIFKCGLCELEYPVVARRNERSSSLR